MVNPVKFVVIILRMIRYQQAYDNVLRDCVSSGARGAGHVQHGAAAAVEGEDPARANDQGSQRRGAGGQQEQREG